MICQVSIPGVLLEDQKDIRESYFNRVEEILGATQQDIGSDECNIGKVFLVTATDEYPTHLAIVTFGCSWNYGNELVIRFLPKIDELENKTLIESLQAVLFILYFMQKNVSFKNLESCAISYPLPWLHDSDGIHGSLITEDCILRGTHYDPNNYVVSEPLHTNYWPQHFLSFHFLFPIEYQLCQSVRLIEFLAIITSRDTYLINDFSRSDYTNDICSEPTPTTNIATTSMKCCIAHSLKDLTSRSPSRLEVPGMTIDLRVRKCGNALDIVLGGTSVSPLLRALHAAFAKPLVPQGTVVSACGSQSFIDFYCHDEEGEPVTQQTAKYVVHTVGVGNEESKLILTLSTHDFQYFALLPPGHLWRGFQLGKVMRIAMFLPAIALAQLPDRFNAALRASRSSFFDEDPLIVDISPDSSVMTGDNGLSGFPSAINNATHGVICLQEPARVRCIVAGCSYFNDSVFLNDQGDFMGQQIY